MSILCKFWMCSEPSFQLTLQIYEAKMSDFTNLWSQKCEWLYQLYYSTSVFFPSTVLLYYYYSFCLLCKWKDKDKMILKVSTVYCSLICSCHLKLQCLQNDDVKTPKCPYCNQYHADLMTTTIIKVHSSPL